jgi:hypothetical protein
MDKWKPRTTKTLCGLTAPLDRIDHEKPTCPDCIEERKRRQNADPQELAKLIDGVTNQA